MEARSIWPQTKVMELPHHGRQAFDAELAELEHDVLEMASVAETMVGTAVDALVRLDPSIAMNAIRRDDDVDERDLDIENRCLRLLALQQPTGVDLRTIGTVMKMITDIERVGDLGVDLAKCALKIEKELGRTDYVDIPKIAGLCRGMLMDALDAFVRRDVDLVADICRRDDEVDALYREIREQIHGHMRHDPDNVVSASWLLLAIHHLERIADHAVNIAERVNFMVTGRFVQMAKSHRSDAPGA